MILLTLTFCYQVLSSEALLAKAPIVKISIEGEVLALFVGLAIVGNITTCNL